MEITVLGSGTSQGVPVIACKCKVCQSEDKFDKRLRASVMFETDDLTIVIDAGPDFRFQMLRENVQKVNAILLSHDHKDHVGGLDDIRAFNYVMKQPMNVYAEHYVQKTLLKDYSYVFAEKKYPGVPEIHLYTIENHPFKINGIEITPVRAMHHRLPVLGYRIGDVAYITDANYIADCEQEKILGCKVLIINALRKEKHLSHFTVQEALEIIDKVKPQKAYLTHISHQMGLHHEVEKELPANVFLAYDGLKMEV